MKFSNSLDYKDLQILKENVLILIQIQLKIVGDLHELQLISISSSCPAESTFLSDFVFNKTLFRKT